MTHAYFEEKELTPLPHDTRESTLSFHSLDCNIPMTMEHNIRQTSRSTPLPSSRTGLRTMPEQRPDNDTNNGHPRRRIPVAVSRLI